VMRQGIAILAVLVSMMASGLGEVGAAGSEVVPIPGEVPPAVATATRLPGSPSPDLSVTLTIVLNPSDQPGFDAFLRDVRDPRSPLFRRSLGQRDLAARFGPSREAYDDVLSWLTEQGFTLVEGSANRLTLTVQGTRGRVEQVFGVRVDDYQIGDRTFY